MLMPILTCSTMSLEVNLARARSRLDAMEDAFLVFFFLEVRILFSPVRFYPDIFRGAMGILPLRDPLCGSFT